jgi:hypothetical protein
MLVTVARRRQAARQQRAVSERVTYRGWGAVTAVSTLKRHQRLRLRAVFAFGNTTTIAIRPLLKMRIIALGRWTLWPDARAPTHLLFETNWSGSDQTYIPDFGRIMPVQWRSIWGATVGFPGAVPTTDLVDLVDVIDAGVGHFWTDYEDGATTHVVTQALALRPEVERFVDGTAGSSPAEFHRRWQNLIVRVHRYL